MPSNRSADVRTPLRPPVDHHVTQLTSSRIEAGVAESWSGQQIGKRIGESSDWRRPPPDNTNSDVVVVEESKRDFRRHD